MENQRNKETETQEKITTNDGINSIIDIRGIQFDISSVLKDVTNSIKNNLKSSFDDVFKDYELYKSTHDALLQIPFIKDMCNKNLELSLQVEILKQDHHDDEDEPTITLNIHETLPDEKENNHDNGGEDINKPIFTEFLKTTKINKKQYENDFEFEIVSEVEVEAEEEEEEEEEAEETDEEPEETDEEPEEIDETEESGEEEDEESQEDEEAEETDEESQEAEETEEEAEESQEEAEESQEEAEESQEEAEETEEETEEEAEEEAEEGEEETEESQEEAEEAEEEEEVYEIVIKNVTYYTTNEKNGDIYSCVNEDVGEIVGKFKNGKPSFIKRK